MSRGLRLNPQLSLLQCFFKKTTPLWKIPIFFWIQIHVMWFFRRFFFPVDNGPENGDPGPGVKKNRLQKLNWKSSDDLAGQEFFRGQLKKVQGNANVFALPETNSSHLPGSHSKRKRIFQPSIFRCELLVSGRVYLVDVDGLMEFTPSKFNRHSPWKIVVGRRSFPIGFRSLFRGKLAVKLREGISYSSNDRKISLLDSITLFSSVNTNPFCATGSSWSLREV